MLSPGYRAEIVGINLDSRSFLVDFGVVMDVGSTDPHDLFGNRGPM